MLRSISKTLMLKEFYNNATFLHINVMLHRQWLALMYYLIFYQMLLRMLQNVPFIPQIVWLPALAGLFLLAPADAKSAKLLRVRFATAWESTKSVKKIAEAYSWR